jgi:hypothetical protein
MSVDTNNLARLLVLCGRPVPGPEAAEAVRSLVRLGPDWGELTERADAEGTLPLLFKNLEGLGDAVPANVRGRLRSAYLANLGRSAYKLRALEPFLKTAETLGLRVAVTKGPRLAWTVYRDLGLRPFWDVDVFVHPSDWAALRPVLDRLGFTESEDPPGPGNMPPRRLDWTYSPYFRKDGLFLEVHFNCLGLHVPIRAEQDFWSSLRPLALAGSKTLMLADEYELCHLCLHAQQHSYRKLIWLTDIAEMASRPGFDWNRLLEICRKEGIQAPVAYGLRLADALWPGTVPRAARSRLETGLLAGAALRFLWPEAQQVRRRQSIAWPYYLPSFFALWERKSVVAAVRTVTGILFPPRGWMAAARSLPESSPRVYLEYARRLWRPVKLAAERLLGAR